MANNTYKEVSELTVKIKLFNTQSEELFSEVWTGDIAANESKLIYKLPDNANYGDVWFVDLEVLDKSKTEIDNGFYWLSSKEDVLDYEASKDLSWPYYTPSREYADFTALNSMQKANVDFTFSESEENDYAIFNVSLKNTTNVIAFFMEMRIVDKNDGSTILPVLWSDNYISLLPNETGNYTAKINKKYLKDKNPVFEFSGINLP